jgi:hypothetical protein
LLAEISQDEIALQPFRRRRFSDLSAVVRPGMAAGGLDHMRAHRVEMDVTQKLLNVSILIHQNGFVAALKSWPLSARLLLK